MNRTKTPLGTPCSPRWSKHWIARVIRIELQLGRRICGASGPGARPCTNQSRHRSGRCRKHGGINGIGAQPGNTNAIVHGLYARVDRRRYPAEVNRVVRRLSLHGSARAVQLATLPIAVDSYLAYSRAAVATLEMYAKNAPQNMPGTWRKQAKPRAIRSAYYRTRGEFRNLRRQLEMLLPPLSIRITNNGNKEENGIHKRQKFLYCAV